MRAFDDAIAATPDNARLKSRRAELELLATDVSTAQARLTEVEAAMQEPGIDPQRAKDLLQMHDDLLAEIRKARR